MLPQNLDPAQHFFLPLPGSLYQQKIQASDKHDKQFGVETRFLPENEVSLYITSFDRLPLAVHRIPKKITMATFHSATLLDTLAADVRQILVQTESLKGYSEEEWRQQPAVGSWSIVEVLAHLNFYARFYIDAMETQLNGHRTQAQDTFRPGFFGNYFTKVIGPSPDGQVRNKMSSPADARPLAPESLDSKAELQEFIDHQHQLLNLLKIARSADLGKIRVPISLTRFIKLKLGDTFRFLIAHEQRHFQQIDRVKEVIKEWKETVRQ
jgi:hypothetical protein